MKKIYCWFHKIKTECTVPVSHTWWHQTCAAGAAVCHWRAPSSGNTLQDKTRDAVQQAEELLASSTSLLQMRWRKFTKLCLGHCNARNLIFGGRSFYLTVMHHHIKFGYKRLSGSEDIFRTKAGYTDRPTHGQWVQYPPPTHPTLS